MDDRSRARAPQGTLSRGRGRSTTSRGRTHSWPPVTCRMPLGLYSRVDRLPRTGDHRGQPARHRQRLLPGQRGGPGLASWRAAAGRRRDAQQLPGLAEYRRRARPARPAPRRDQGLPRGRPPGTGERQGRDRLAPGLAGQGDRQQRRRTALFRPEPRRRPAVPDDLRDHRDHGHRLSSWRQPDNTE